MSDAQDAGIDPAPQDDGPRILPNLPADLPSDAAVDSPQGDDPVPEKAETETAEAKEAREQEERDRDERGRFKKPVQPRIDELTRQFRDEQREKEYWKQRALQAATPDAARATTADPDAEPDPDNFENEREYLRAAAKYDARQEVRASREEAMAALERQRIGEQWQARQAAARGAIPDYDEVVSGTDVNVAPHVAQELLASEFGPQLTYHLASHPEVADRLNALLPRDAIRAIAKLETQFERAAAPAPQSEAVAPRRTSASPPATPIKAGAASNVNLEKLPMDEYVAARAKQGATWVRR